MLPIFTKASWLRTATLIWVMAWTMMVPLFHVHPETDHSHGNVTHAHAGIIHTVFSQDLDGEFDGHQHESGDFSHTAPEQTTFSSHPAHHSEPSEVGFSVLSNSTDRKLSKPVFSHGPVTEAALMRGVTPRSPTEAENGLPPLHTFLTHDIPSRAPPSFLI